MTDSIHVQDHIVGKFFVDTTLRVGKVLAAEDEITSYSLSSVFLVQYSHHASQMIFRRVGDMTGWEFYGTEETALAYANARAKARDRSQARKNGVKQ